MSEICGEKKKQIQANPQIYLESFQSHSIPSLLANTVNDIVAESDGKSMEACTHPILGWGTWHLKITKHLHGVYV